MKTSVLAFCFVPWYTYAALHLLLGGVSGGLFQMLSMTWFIASPAVLGVAMLAARSNGVLKE